MEAKMSPSKPPEQIKPQSLGDYLEVMSKAVFQSGMSWKVVESKWETTREAFQDFEVGKVANMDERDLDLLVEDTRVIRNYRKLAAIIENAQRMIELEKEFGTFKKYLQAHGDFDSTLKVIKRDFKFMGDFGVYYFLYVVGEEVPPHDEFEATYRK
jgi:DNA-3-methyladenine glycosylase I